MGDGAELAQIFVGIGVFLVFCAFAWLICLLGKIFNAGANEIEAESEKDIKYHLFEEVMVERLASEKGIDLKKEEVYKRELKGMNHRKFRKTVQDEILKRVSSDSKK